MTTDGGSERVNQIIAAYLEAERLDQAPDREELLRQHPDLAAELQSSSKSLVSPVIIEDQDSCSP